MCLCWAGERGRLGPGMRFGVAPRKDAVNHPSVSSSLESGTVPVPGESRSVDLPGIGVTSRGWTLPDSRRFPNPRPGLPTRGRCNNIATTRMCQEGQTQTVQTQEQAGRESPVPVDPRMIGAAKPAKVSELPEAPPVLGKCCGLGVRKKSCTVAESCPLQQGT